MNRKLARLAVLPMAGFAVSTAAVLGLSGSAMAATPAHAPVQASTVRGAQVQGSTGMTIKFDNNTDQTLTLVSASNPYGHWQDRAPQTIAAHTTGVSISDYSNNIEGSEIDVTYALPDGSQVTFQGLVPLAGSDSISGSTTNPAYVLHGQSDAGFHPTYHFQLGNA
ncbi:hypothetical protein [Kineococcus sp. SYSU DK005]|uniref:hypothetical protein n=1 Tax=Kineococcus sp. SYSU DK005 TaxID=3383126 RepID=UPI003D7C8E8F